MTRHRHRGSTNRSTTYHPDQSGYSAVPSPVANDGCLSSLADFIPSWLHHMQACHNDPPQDIPQQKRPIDSTNLSWHPNGLTTVRIQSNCDTGRYQPSDIFIQGSPSQSSLPDQKCHHQYRQSAPNSDHGQNLDNRERDRHPIQPKSTTSETSLTRNTVFEKQPRRKTRRDRYDTVKSKAERMEGGQRKKPSTRVTKKGRLRSSREVMANFSSRAIANASEKITLDQKFTPGLFVNGRSSTSLADLAFNDIPLNHENVETCEKGHPSKPEPKQRERGKSRQDEIKIFADALKRLIADYPPPKSASPPNRTIVSSGACTQRINGDSAGRLLPRGSHTPRSLSIRSHPTAVNSCRNLTPEARGRPTTEKELTAVISCEDHKPHCHETVEPPKYEDKGIMVSPWMHQRAAENMSYGTVSADHQLRPRRRESSNSRAEIHMSSAYFETSAPEVGGKCRPEQTSIDNRACEYPSHLPNVSERFSFKESRVEDVTHTRDNVPPIPYFIDTSGRYPPPALHPHLSKDLTSFDHLDASKIINTQSRDTYSIDWPAKPMVAKQIYQPHQEAFQELNTISRKSSKIVDDIPGETLKEYIERMEREILGESELSAPCIDKALPLSEANIFDNGRRPMKCLRRIEYNDDLPRRDQSHEGAHPFSGSYPRSSYPEESPDESESTFFWRPNHMMWC
ncbi:uncharacterized protein TrAFT101_003952 [Trichoderma asperellum]|uniref:Uncharacterized protein n=1 Tax=Trichoderma asperellum (strain ATCC 204424 / CBS 433.97 / NBRC 101777) TaxID=1042311 RepID=A0A2T3ZP71_TRIA4|nr:hypothetical protein M441DRAFT_220310 [Trichoderma asperellum CBS 433.97]PTB46597.1 hypothetical protein M441DRAFT_220310 [Trichoderma asperellum CBS 433.97]UKZ88190.1 hypothetical protein TrAFT101_003952 [Trichoderma asperellum]